MMNEIIRRLSYRWFQRTATAIMVIFIGLMVLVVLVAYSRRSGNTGLDMAKIQKLRNPDSGPQSANAPETSQITQTTAL